MKPGISDNVLCDIFVYNSRKCKLIYSDRENQGSLEMRLVFRNEREGVYRSTRKKFGMVVYP